MVQNGKIHRENSHSIIHFSTSKGVSEVSEQSQQGGASEWVSCASEQANGQASDPVFTSGFLVDLAHSVWSKTPKTPGVSTLPLACPFAHSLTYIAHSFTCSAMLALICLLAISLTQSRASKKVNHKILKLQLFWTMVQWKFKLASWTEHYGR